MEKFKRIALTGYRGSIGREFPKNCQKLYTRLEDSIVKMFIEINKLKIKPHTLVHLSALVSTQECEKNSKKAFELNVEGAKKWYKAAKLSGVKNFLFISTSHIYKPINSYNVYTNTFFKKDPKGIYGKTKLEAEKKLIFLSKIKGYPKLTIVRVFSVYSFNARKGFLIHDLLNRKKKKDYSTLKGLNLQRDFLSTERIAQNILKICKKEKKKNLYQICSGKSKSIEKVCIEILGKKFFEKCKKDNNSKSNWLSLIGRPTVI